MASEISPKNDRRTIFGWCMYDWANSAYGMMVVSLLPVYFTSTIVGPGGLVLFGTRYYPDSLWAFMIGFADVMAFFASPVLGAVADFSASKLRFLLAFAYGGSLFTVLLYFSRGGDFWQTFILFVLAQFAFISANVFYDAFLPQIASPDQMDWISGKGYSYGYVGGGLQFALSLVLVTVHDRLGISQEMAVRIGLAFAGVWWAGFTIFTARLVSDQGIPGSIPDRYHGWWRPLALAAIGFRRTLATTRHVGRFRHLVLFLISFMLYNDGIQSVITLATTYGAVELHLPTSVLMATLLLIQIIATGGALLFGRIAERFGTKNAIMITLVLWSAVVVYAYFIHSATEFMTLGAVVGLILGGSQALSRSFFGSMIPEQASAEFYGFYTVFTKFSSIWGPFAFAIIKQISGSSRLAIVSLMVFFVVGLLLLSQVDEEKAREARAAGAF
ncbi:MAG TPA: MFS transporter [Terriglobales bacterium]|nr:MFS transporter [Terriglobales bacterium]